MATEDQEMTASRPNRDWLWLGLLGLAFAAGYGFLGIEFGDISLSSEEAWSRGITQPYVASGMLLAILAAFLRTGAKWAQWAILMWCPITIVGGMSWTLSRGVGHFDLTEFLVLGLPIMVAWVWAMWPYRGVKRRNEPSA